MWVTFWGRHPDLVSRGAVVILISAYCFYPPEQSMWSHLMTAGSPRQMGWSSNCVALGFLQTNGIITKLRPKWCRNHFCCRKAIEMEIYLFIFEWSWLQKWGWILRLCEPHRWCQVLAPKVFVCWTEEKRAWEKRNLSEKKHFPLNPMFWVPT